MNAELKFTDYDIRIWDGMITISSHKRLSYATGFDGSVFAMNTYDEEIKENVMSLCDKIALEFIALDNVLNDLGGDDSDEQ